MKRIIIAGTGASGMPYLERTLEYFSSRNDYEVHLVLTKASLLVINQEIGKGEEQLASKVSKYYKEEEVNAPIASGSFKTEGMLIVPCSTRTLSAIANGFSDNLVSRAAEVTLKERRKLVLVLRETPLSLMDVENMKKVILSGGIVMPASPAFYGKPKTVNDLVDFVVGRALTLLGIDNDLYPEWRGRRLEPLRFGGVA
ncbi:MAG: UbiX family flavin prenyltransferase [Candidatus Marsarchaeota archaeon]